jgi:uncharacterized FlgJ-related protein
MLYFFDRDSLKYKRFPLHYIVVPVTITILILIVRPDKIVIKRVHSHEVLIKQPVNLRFTVDRFKQLLKDINIKHPDIVFAQARLETGNFTSKIFRNNNNLFGFKVALSRPTVCIGLQSNHAAYDSWQMSVIDYALWQSKHCARLSRDQYIEYLRDNYAEDSNYINKLKL